MTDRSSNTATVPDGRGPKGAPSGTLSARHIIFFVIAAAAPLGFAVGSIPLAIGRGGIGTAAMFIIAGGFLALFAVGYVAMTRFVPNAGALFSYITAGLGRPLGIGVAFVAAISYALVSAGAVGPFAVFAEQTAQSLFGVAVPWPVWALAGILVMGLLGQLNVELNMRVLGFFMIAEVTVLAILGVAVVSQGGASGISMEALSPAAIAEGQIGVVLLFVFAAFAGFEATALFREEAKHPVRTLRRATFGSIAVIALLQSFVAWYIVQAFGATVVDVANATPTEMFAIASRQYVGDWFANVVTVLVVLSWFASVSAFHNATTRYLVALSRDGVIPAIFTRRSRRTNAPWVASLTHSLFALVLIVLCILAGLDPYLDLFILGSVPVAVSIPAMELLTAIAVVAFFLRDRRGQSPWAVYVAPAVSAIALAIVVYLVLANMEFYTAQTGPINWILPGINLVVLGIGVARALWIRSRTPHLYDRIGRFGLE
ncbi:APC family permease [Arthrobacter sp. AK01]|uniref:APC family permease n=1 Tax=Arthrobacter sp. AK01 TaxID=2894084 RepID=UPI001E2A0F6E|nr:APC family permease [Arthrobacter sp. AK01]MCD4851104.1 APC family permease [Arthrobacter sp. AK01]